MSVRVRLPPQVRALVRRQRELEAEPGTIALPACRMARTCGSGSPVSADRVLRLRLRVALAGQEIVGSQQGDVFTDFDVVAKTDPPNVQQRGTGPRGGREVRLSHQTRYAVGGGGSEIRMTTFNGDVMIRKR